jgi:septal ring factor EnvC (AmiA/AmiB activator)
MSKFSSLAKSRAIVYTHRMRLDAFKQEIISELELRLQPKFDRMDQHYGGIAKAGIGVLTLCLSAICAQMNLMESRIDKRFEQVDKHFEQVDKRFDRVESDMKEMQTDISDMKADLKLILHRLNK